jgi:hypothetical protein
MLGFDGQTAIVTTVEAAATLSPAFEVTGWNHVALDIPTFSVYCGVATASVYLQGSQSINGTYRRIKDIGEYSAGAGILDWEVPESVGNYLVCCRPAERFNYLKVELSATTTAAMAIGVIVHK